MSDDASTLRLEAEVARRQSPAFAWPTVVLTVGVLGLWVGSSWLALAGLLPFWLAVLLNAVAMYAIYTPVHDASHHAVVPRSRRWRWVNTVVGTAAGVPLIMPLHVHRKSHNIHHARTNMPEDPDTFAMGDFWTVAFVKTPRMILNQLNPLALWRNMHALRLSTGQKIQTIAQYGLTVAAWVALVAAGYGVELLLLWVLPWILGELVMQVTFGWFPHHDHSETGRYRDTRISLFPGGDVLYLQQNLHLIHHMLPAVPWYRYRAVFDELRPVLEQHGARIEGFWPYSRPTAG